MSQRKDGRTTRQFKSDILSAHSDEAKIILRYAVFLRDQSGAWPDIKPSGTDFTGTYKEKDNEISNDADFIVDGGGVEVTKSKDKCDKYFHQKVVKVKNAFQNNSIFIFVNGFVDDEPQFCLISKRHLEKLVLQSVEKYGVALQPGANGQTNKAAFRFDLSWIEYWFKLPRIKYLKMLKQKYPDIFEVAFGEEKI